MRRPAAPPLPTPHTADPVFGGPIAYPVGESAAPPPRRFAWWGAVRRHAWLVAGAGALAGLAAAAAVRVITPVYESEASVRVEIKETHLPGVYQRVVTGAEVGNELDLLRSRTLAERVVDSLGLRADVVRPRGARAATLAAVRATRSNDSGTFTFRRGRDGFTVWTGDPARQVAVARPTEPVQLAGATLVLAPTAAAMPRIDVNIAGFDATVAALKRTLVVERAGRESQVIDVRYRSNDRTLARDVPNVAVASFLGLRRRGEQVEASSTAAALRDQIRAVAQELTQADATFRDFRERQHVVSPKEEGTAQITRLAQLRTERLQVGAERDALAALMRTLAARRSDAANGELPYRQLVGFPTLMRNEAVWSYVRALTAVEEQRAALLVRRTPEDPDVLALTDRTQALEQQLRSTASTYLDGLTQQTAAVDAELARSERELAQLPGQEAEYARLERGPKVLGEMLTLLQTRLKEAEVAESVADPTVQRLDVAPLPLRPVRPRPVRDVALASCAGLLLGLAGVLTRDRLDRTVRTREDVRSWSGLPVLGMIPHAAAGFPVPGPSAAAVARPHRRALLAAGRHRPEDAEGLILLEAFARLQTTVAVGQPGGCPRTVVVTSPLSEEGKTTTAGNLALAVAREGQRTLLVDADLRRGALHERFGVARAPGLAEVLVGEATLDAVLRPVEVEGGGVLVLVPAGAARRDPSRRLLTAETVRALFAMGTERFDRVVVDAPPINLTADAAVLTGAADGVLLVARAGRTPLDALAYAVQQLAQTGATPLGVVVNDVRPGRDSAYDAEYRFYDSPYVRASGAA